MVDDKLFIFSLTLALNHFIHACSYLNASDLELLSLTGLRMDNSIYSVSEYRLDDALLLLFHEA